MVGIYHVGQNLDSAPRDARCVHYFLWEVVPRVYHTLGDGLLA